MNNHTPNMAGRMNRRPLFATGSDKTMTFARIVVAGCMLAFASTVFAATNTWQGGVATNLAGWSVGANWSSGAAPTGVDNLDVLIPAGRTYYPVLTANAVVDGSLTVAAGASLALTNFNLALVDLAVNNTKGIRIAGTLSACTNSVITVGRGGFVNTGTVSGQPVLKFGAYFFDAVLASGGTVFSGLITDQGSYAYAVVITNDVTIAGNVTLNGGALTVQAGKTLTISNDLVFGSGSGRAALNLFGEVLLYGTIKTATDTNSSCNGLNDGWVNMVGSGDQIISNATGYLPPIKVNKADGRLKVVGNLNCCGLYVCASNAVEFEPGKALSFGGYYTCAGARGLENYGTITHPPALVCGYYAYNAKLRSGGVTFPSLTVTNTGNSGYGLTLLDPVSIAGDVQLISAGYLALSSNTLTIGGSYCQDTNVSSILNWSSTASLVFTSSVAAVIGSGGTAVGKTLPNVTINKPNSWLTVTNATLIIEGALTILDGELRPSAGTEIWLGAKRWGYPACISDVGLKTTSILTSNSFAIAAGPEIPQGTNLYNIAPYANIRTAPYATLAWRMTDTEGSTNLGTATRVETVRNSYIHYEFVFPSPQPVAAIRYCQRQKRFALSADTTGNGTYDDLFGIQGPPANGTMSVWLGRDWFETRCWPTRQVYAIRMDVLEDSGAGTYEFQILSPSSNLVVGATPLAANVPLVQTGQSVTVSDPEPAQRFIQGFHCEPWMFGSESFFPGGANAPPPASTWSSYAPLLQFVNDVKAYHANLLWIFPPVTFNPVRGPGLYEYDSLWPSAYQEWSTTENHLKAIAGVMQANGVNVFVQNRDTNWKGYTDGVSSNPGPIVSTWYRNTWAGIVGEEAASGIDGVSVCQDEMGGWPGNGSYTLPVNSNAFVARFGINPPTEGGDTDAYRKWMIFAYEQVAAGFAQVAQTAHTNKPGIRTTANALPDGYANARWDNCHAAWDISGHMADMNLFGSESYHTQDDADMGHYAIAARTKRLIAASTNRGSMVTMNCPWANDPTNYPGFYWHFPPASMWGQPISSMMHGGQAFAYWRWNYIFYGGYDAHVKKGYALLDTLAAWGAKSAHVPRDIAVLKSRASEDWWQVKVSYNPSAYSNLDQYRGYFYEYWLLEFLFMNGYPFEMYYQDQAQDYQDSLSQFKLVILPFPYSMSQATYTAIATAANAGTKFIALDHQGEVDEYGTAHAAPLLTDLVAQGKVTFITNDVTVVGHYPEFLESMRTNVDALLGDRKPIYLNRYGHDVEAASLEKSDTEKFLFLINWAHHPVTVDAGIRMPAGVNYRVLCRDLNGTYETTIGGASVVAATNLWTFRVSLDTDEVKAFYVAKSTNPAAIGLMGNLAFGNVATGQAATSILTITNCGNALLTFTIGYPAGFSGALTGSVAAGKATNVTVTFAPVAEQSYGGIITVLADATSEANAISCSGAGIAMKAVIRLLGNPAFGYVMTGQTATSVWAITNAGNATLTVTNIVYPSGFSGAWIGAVAAGTATNVIVTFAPTALQSYGGDITVFSDAASGTNVIACSGIGATAPAQAVTPFVLAFGPVTVNTTNMLLFTVQNTGAGSLTGSVGGVSAPFSIVGSTNYVLNGGTMTTVTVRFASAAAGAYSNNVAFNSRAGNLLRPVTGTGTRMTATVILTDLSQTYSGTARPVTSVTVPVNLSVVVTYDGGVAVPVNAGSYDVIGTVSEGNYQGATNGTLVVAKANQTVLFPEIPDQEIAGIVTLSATAGSGLTVSYSATGPAVLNGNTLIFAGTGMVSIVAGQAGNADWNAAANVTKNVAVNAALPPFAPTGVQASDGTYTNKVRVTWNAASAATGYQVWRSASNNISIASTLVTTASTTYDDLNAATMPGTILYYWVKAVNAADAGGFSANDSGYVRPAIGPTIKAKGTVGDVAVNYPDAMAITIEINEVNNAGAPVEWWVISLAGSSWYYLNRSVQWAQFDGTLSNCDPVYQGASCNLPATLLPELNIPGLPVSSYTFWFAVDAQMDGILNLDEQTMADSVNVNVLSAFPVPRVKANGTAGVVTVNYPETVSIIVAMNAGGYAGVPVDWWVVGFAGSSWYYLDSASGWTHAGAVRPVHQGGLVDLPATEVLNITGLPVGLYTFYFAVDYPMDGILNIEGPMLVDSVTVVVR